MEFEMGLQGKLTVKPYLHTSKAARNTGRTKKYPLYIAITLDRKTVYIRSRFNQFRDLSNVLEKRAFFPIEQKLQELQLSQKETTEFKYLSKSEFKDLINSKEVDHIKMRAFLNIEIRMCYEIADLLRKNGYNIAEHKSSAASLILFYSHATSHAVSEYLKRRLDTVIIKDFHFQTTSVNIEYPGLAIRNIIDWSIPFKEIYTGLELLLKTEMLKRLNNLLADELQMLKDWEALDKKNSQGLYCYEWPYNNLYREFDLFIQKRYGASNKSPIYLQQALNYYLDFGGISSIIFPKPAKQEAVKI
jgi:hypothetical protein